MIKIHSEIKEIEQNYCAHCVIKRFMLSLKGGGGGAGAPLVLNLVTRYSVLLRRVGW